MIHKIPLILLALALSFPAAALAQDFPFDQFEPTTLAAVTHDLESEVAGDLGGANQAVHHKAGDILVEAPILRRRAQVIYTGQHRAMDPVAISFYRGYQKAHAVENSVADHYRDAYLFQEDGVDYWLPVQDQVAAYFRKELKPGQPVQLYLLVTGGYLESDGWTWIMPVEEFNAEK